MQLNPKVQLSSNLHQPSKQTNQTNNQHNQITNQYNATKTIQQNQNKHLIKQ